MSHMSDRERRFLHFSSVYFAQGVLLSYFLTFNILYLRQQGLQAGEIGLFQAALMVPFVLKILIGLLSDRFSLFGLGHRYPYILLGLSVQLAMILCLPLVALPQALTLFFVVALIAASGMAMYDTCTDGLAVETTPEKERSLIQGVMVGTRAAGILVTLVLGGWVIDAFGWSALFLTMAILTLPAVIFTLRYWQAPPPAERPGFDWSVFRLLLQRNTLLLAAMGVVYALALDSVLSYLSYHRGAGSVSDVALVSGLVALSMVGRIAGALFSGRISERLGYRRSFQVAIVLSVLACLSLSLNAGTLVLSLSSLMFGFSYGYYTTVYAATAMLLSDPRVAASMFAIFMMFLNLGVAGGQAIGGIVIGYFGFSALVLLMSIVSLLNLLLVRKLARE